MADRKFLLVRHAPISKETFELTEPGRAIALEMGVSVRQKYGSDSRIIVIACNSKRTIQTSELFISGAGKDLEGRIPELFIDSDMENYLIKDQAGYDKLVSSFSGLQKFSEAWRNGSIPPEIAEPPEEVASRFLGVFLKPCGDFSLGVMIANVQPVRAILQRITGQNQYELGEKPKYGEFIDFQLEGRLLKMFYRSKEYSCKL